MADDPSTKKQKLNPDEKPKKFNQFAPTLKQINEDQLTQTGLQYWGRLGDPEQKPFDPSVIEDIYKKELSENMQVSRVMMLELSNYLENYLWPNFEAGKSSPAHLMSIVIMVNEKFRENIEAWACFRKNENGFASFFVTLLELYQSGKLHVREKTHFILFLTNCFQSLSDSMIRTHCMSMISLELWESVSEGRREEVFTKVPKLRELRKRLEVQSKKRTRANLETVKNFIPDLINDYFKILASISPQQFDLGSIRFCERFIEFLIDLMSQLATRRFLHLLLDDLHFVIRSARSTLAQMKPQGDLFKQVLAILRFYKDFEIDNFTGEALSDNDMTKLHYAKMKKLQRVAFKTFPELRRFALTNIASINTKEALHDYLAALDDQQLLQLCASLNLVQASKSYERSFLLEVIIAAHQKRLSQLEVLNLQPLYPNEDLLWDTNQIPTDNFTGEHCLALPKLNLQFLTFHDYLLRNLTLFRLESTYQIKMDLEDSITRMRPVTHRDGRVDFHGSARMAAKIDNVKIVHVAPPLVGFTVPGSVIAEVSFTIPPSRTSFDLKEEWDQLREHDNVFLLCVRPPLKDFQQADQPNEPFKSKFGVIYVRGGEISQVRDEDGTTISDPNPDRKPITPIGSKRTLRLWLDPAQYQLDLDRKNKKIQVNAVVGEDKEQGDGEDVYQSLNLLIRRKPKENNFKAVLECIRDLINAQGEFKVPKWLKDVFLGYGDPVKSQNASLQTEINFNDTFISLQHLKDSFPSTQTFTFDKQEGEMVPPFRLALPKEKGQALQVGSPILVNQGPYPQDVPKSNSVPFTPVQVQAIRQSMNEGLTLVVGPPGTGKTDVAVQIVNNWYHNFPTQHTLIVTHSNQALNQIFEKIMKLNVDERHLIRLGHGQKDLETDEDFSKLGRVNYMLTLRLQKLEEVKRLALSFEMSEDNAYTCETAEHFFLHHVLHKWEQFKVNVEEERKNLKDTDENGNPVDRDPAEAALIEKHFPFMKFFQDVQPLFAGSSYDAEMEIAEGCFRHVRRIFEQLSDCRSFELLKSSYDRGNYLLMKQAKIVAMTCTHAALKRRELFNLGFKFDNLLMEESGQILEIETFIPMVLQNQDPEAPPRLKRVVLIGDHNQLPPVVKNMGIQKYGHLDQSLFTRFVRLGVPTIQLDAQGRTRPSIAALFNWRYPKLGNLPRVLNSGEYLTANPGFRYEYQFVNVEDFNGRGETAPSPYFFQNHGEAEYLVSVFMYMRRIGIPAEKITILTSYNGQKHLLREIVTKRCSDGGFGHPLKITTVDRYQGQQNDYVLLSLVRTQTVGHIRDIRRLVVAMSRARLGLYVFGRMNLFSNCVELSKTFKLFASRPTKLILTTNETYPTQRKLGADVPVTDCLEVQDTNHMAMIAHPHQPLSIRPPQK